MYSDSTNKGMKGISGEALDVDADAHSGLGPSWEHDAKMENKEVVKKCRSVSTTGL